MREKGGECGGRGWGVRGGGSGVGGGVFMWMRSDKTGIVIIIFVPILYQLY